MEKKAKIISVCMEKGGVGKTTLTVNLSTALAEIREKKVLVLDLDPQHNASSILFYRRNYELAGRHSPTIYDLLTSEEDEFDADTENIDTNALTIEKSIVQTPIKNLDIIPANLKLACSERNIRRPFEQEKIVRNILHKSDLINKYDYILIDNSPSLGLLTINSLVASDYVLIPTTCEHLSIIGLDLLLRSINPIKKNINTSLQILGIIITFFRKDWRIHREGEQNLREAYGSLLFNSCVRQNSKLREAPGIHQTIFEYDQTCRGAEDIIKVMNEFLEKVNDTSFSSHVEEPLNV